jgi:hypothetical protein
MDKNIKYKDSQNYSKEIVDVLEERNIPWYKILWKTTSNNINN